MSVTRFVTLFSMFLTTLIVVGRLGATQVWDNSASTWEWNTALNWSGDVVPTSGSGNDALFDSTSPGGTPITVTGQTPTARHIGFGSTDGTLSTVAAYTFNDGGSGELRIRNAGYLQNFSNAGSVQTFNVNYTQAGSSTINPVGGAFVFNGLYTANGDLFIDNDPGPLAGISDKPINFNGGMTGAGAMTINSPTPVTVAGTVTRAGATTINNGVLTMNGTHTGGGDYTVGIDGTLRGTGSISSNAIVNGVLAPGTSIGTLGVGGNVDLNGSLVIEFNSGDDTIDLLNVTGSLDLTGGGISFVDLGSFSLDQPAYVFATYGSLIGDPAVESGVPLGYKVEYHYDNGVNTNNIALVPVPEPNAIGLVLLGLLGLTGLRAGKLS